MRKVKYKAISPEGQVHHIDCLTKWVREKIAEGEPFSMRYLQESIYTRGKTGFGSWYYGWMEYKKTGWKFKAIGDRTKGKGDE